jgi:excisionase family DNA binding protein
MEDGYYTAKTLAKKVHVSEQHIYNLCNQGKLRFIKWGRSKRIPYSAVKEYEESQCQSSSNMNGQETGTLDIKTAENIRSFQLAQAIRD